MYVFRRGLRRRWCRPDGKRNYRYLCFSSRRKIRVPASRRRDYTINFKKIKCFFEFFFVFAITTLNNLENVSAQILVKFDIIVPIWFNCFLNRKYCYLKKFSEQYIFIKTFQIIRILKKYIEWNVFTFNIHICKNEIILYNSIILQCLTFKFNVIELSSFHL